MATAGLRALLVLLLVGGAPTGEAARVLVVASELAGVVPNGGIGTFYGALAEALGRRDHDVTVLYTQGERVHNAAPGKDTFAYWVGHYERRGVKLAPLPAELRPPGASWHAGAAYAALEYCLRHGPFDVVHATDWQGHGYYVAAAKAAGDARLAGTTVAVMAHGPLAWARRSNGEQIDTLDDLESDFLERQSVRLADVLITPSAYLLGWLRDEGWRLPAAAHVKPYIMPQAAKDLVAQAVASVAAGGKDDDVRFVPEGADAGNRRPFVRPYVRVQELVFFGRLEVRKGLVLFCDALDALLGSGLLPANVSIAFLGSDRNTVDGVDGGTYARRRAEAWEGRVAAVGVHTGLDTVRALEYLLDGPRLAVMPSLVENSPLSLLELMGAGVPFVASTAGGIPEAIAEPDRRETLFSPELGALKAKLLVAMREGARVPRPAHTPEAIEAHWVDWHEAEAAKPRESGETTRWSRRPPAAAPLVAAVVLARSGGLPLGAAVRSVLAQGAPLAAVIVVAVYEGAPATAAEALAPELAGRITWASLPGAGAGEARNAGAELAARSGATAVLFTESGAVLDSSLVGKAAAALARLNATVVAPAGQYYAGELPAPAPSGEQPLPQHRRMHVHLGASLANGAFRNCFGGPVLLVALAAFQRHGGYGADVALGEGYDHWELLARLALAGERVEVLPEALFAAPGMPGVFLHRRDDPGVRAAVTPYLAHLPSHEHAAVLGATSLGSVGALSR